MTTKTDGLTVLYIYSGTNNLLVFAQFYVYVSSKNEKSGFLTPPFQFAQFDFFVN